MSTKLTTCLLILTLLVMVGVLLEMHALRGVVKGIGKVLIERQIAGDSVVTERSWISGGHRFTWTVTKGGSETQAAYDARCIAEFAEQLALHPQD